MPVPRATGYPDYSYKQPGDPGNAWIPIIFSGKLLEKFYTKTTMTNITTTDYIGEIKNKGDRVVIRTLPDITIRDYEKGGTLQLEYPESPAIELTINRAKYFNFAMDDIDVFFTDMNWLDKYADDAAQQLKIAMDREFFQDIIAYAHPDNQGVNAGTKTHLYNLGAPGAPVTLTKDNVLDFLVDCDTVLDEQDVPDEDRWIVLPPAVFNIINKSDLKDASFAGRNPSFLLQGGFTGKQIGRLNVFQSNLLPFVSAENAFYIPFGRKGALVSAAAFNKVEYYRPDNTFADAMKGLTVYDWAVVYPQQFGMLYATVTP